mgnify:CR=1 FL=1
MAHRPLSSPHPTVRAGDVSVWVCDAGSLPNPDSLVPDLSAGESEDEFMKRELAELTARRAEADVGCHAAQQ